MVKRWSVRVAVGALVLVAAGLASPALAHEDPPGHKINDYAVITEVWTDRSWDDGFLFFPGDSEICIIAIFGHPGHDRFAITKTTSIDGVETTNAYSFYEWVEECKNDVNMSPATAGPPPTPHFYFPAQPPAFDWHLISSTTRNAMANDMPALRHPECKDRVAWTVRVQGYEHDSSEAKVIKKVTKAIQKAADLSGDKKWKTGSKAGAVVGDFIASLFSNRKIGTVNLDFPFGQNSDEGDGGNLFVKGEVKQEDRDTVKGIPVLCATSTPEPTSTPIPNEQEQCIPSEAFGTDSEHPFSKNASAASTSWSYLESATFDIPDIGSDPEEVTPDPEGLKETWIETIGNIGSTVASAEVEEAANTPSKVPSLTLSDAQTLLAQGNILKSNAETFGDAALLSLALGFYRNAFDSVVSLLHPACAVGGIAELADVGEAATQATNSSSSDAGLLAVVATATVVAASGAAWYVRRRSR